MRPVTSIPRDKARNFAATLVKELSGNHSENRIDMVDRLNRRLTGWATFYQFNNYTAMTYKKIDGIVFWRLAHWLARKYRVSIKPLMRKHFRRPEGKEAKNSTDYALLLTLLRTRSGWLYLAVVLDLFSRKIVGWFIAPSMLAELVCSAIQLAIAQSQLPPGLIAHSDSAANTRV
tara:strand:+ start:12033 stop:12557 length:525 start_codon:yes stop_codon:yes gene_type:complete